MSSGESNEKTRIYFIRHPDHQIEPVEKFLRNREFETYSSIDFKDALTNIIRVQPHFIFVCMDHSNRKIMAVPKILAQSFPVTVVPFIYSTAMASVRMLQNMPHEYKLFPPNTGPSIQRLINKIKKSEQNTGLSKEKKERGQIISENQTSGAPNNSHLIRVGGAAKSAGTWNIRPDDAKKVLADLIEIGEDSSGSIEDFFGHDNGSENKTSSQNSSGSKSPAYMPSHQGNQHSSPHGLPPAAAYNPSHSQGSNWQSNGNDPQVQGTSSNPSHYNPQLPSLTGQNSIHPPASKNSSSPAGPAVFPENKIGSASSSFDDSKNSKSSSSSLQGKINSTPTRAGKSHEKSKLEYGVEDSLIHVSGGNYEDGGTERVSRVSNAVCLAVQSQKFTGYLVAAFGSQKKIDPNFISLMKQRLTQFLLTQGEKIHADDKMNIKIHEVEFEAWAIAQAEFLKKSVHSGNEVAMAFFPTQHAKPELHESENKEMVKVSINDIHEDKAVEFDLYIFLQANQKYILYTHNGEFLAGEQKLRLKTRGVTHLHFRKEELPDFKKYHAEKYLDSKITDFEQSMKASEAVGNKKAS